MTPLQAWQFLLLSVLKIQDIISLKTHKFYPPPWATALKLALWPFSEITYHKGGVVHFKTAIWDLRLTVGLDSIQAHKPKSELDCAFSHAFAWAYEFICIAHFYQFITY